MSNPTRPDESNPEAGVQPSEAQPGPNDQSIRPDAAPTAAEPAAEGSGDAPPKAQAYVDPTIAAEAQAMALEAEVAELKDKFIRAHAEMDNLRKRTEREKADASKYAITKFAGDVLAVADNLQRALSAFAQAGEEPDAHTKTLIEGVELTETELSKALERNGVKKIEALGAIFDPNFHQAVMEEEDKETAAGTVLRVFQEGYQIGDRVLRPSMVVVARGGFKPVKAPDPAEAPPVGESAPPAANDDVPPAADTTDPAPETDQSA